MMKKPSFDSKNLTKKKNKLQYFFKIRDQIQIKKDRRTNLIILNENINQKSNSKFFI